MAVSQGRARSGQRLLRLSAARRDLGLEQCRARRRPGRDPAGRHAVRPQMHARDARGVARRGAGGGAHRHARQHPFQRRPHLRQPARPGRADHRVPRLRRGDAGAHAGGARGHDAQLALARPRRRLLLRGDGHAFRFRGHHVDAADPHLRARAGFARRRQGSPPRRGRAGAYRRRHRRLRARRQDRLHRRHPLRQRPSGDLGRADRQLDQGVPAHPRLGRRDGGARARADHRQGRRARHAALSRISARRGEAALRCRHGLRGGGARHLAGAGRRLDRSRAHRGQRPCALSRVRRRQGAARRQRTVSRRTVLGFGAAAGLLPAAAWAESEPLKLGFLTVSTGPLAAGGKQMEEGLLQFLKERNGTLAGRKIELVTADTGGLPAQAKTKTQELVERSNVQVIIGPLATYEALAIDDYLRQGQVPLITPTSAASLDLRGGREVNPWLIHAVGTAPQVTHPLGEYAAKTLGYKRMATVADDFTYGHEGVSGFQRSFEDNGGKIVQKLWPPLSVTDYGTFIAQIKRDVDAVYIGFAGVNGLRFLKQYAEYGLHDKIPVLGNTTSTDEGILRVMGDEALGVVTAGWYAASLQSPDNYRFVEAIRVTYGHDPGFYTAGTYSAGLFLEAALTALKGDTSNPEALRGTLRKTWIVNGPIGSIKLDAYGTPILDVHIRKVERRNGRLVNAIVTTYHDVGQFWKYEPRQFLTEPPYSRDYPPAKHLE